MTVGLVLVSTSGFAIVHAALLLGLITFKSKPFLLWFPTDFVRLELQKGKTFEELKAELGEANLGMAQVDINGNAGQEKSFSQIAKYPYEELIKAPEELPEGVDPTQREVYLLLYTCSYNPSYKLGGKVIPSLFKG